MLGGYSGVPLHYSSVLQGIRERLGDTVRVLYHEGCKITIGGSWNQDEVVPSDPDEDRASIAEAVKVAAEADVVILAIGGNEQTSREAWAKNHLGDRADLEMCGRQDELVTPSPPLESRLWLFSSTGDLCRSATSARKLKRSSSAGTWVRRPAESWPRRCSETIVRGASCQ